MNWSINILVNGMDFVVVFYLFYGFTDKKIIITFRKAAFGVLWALIMGTCAEFLEHDIFRLIAHSCYLILMQFLYRKKIYNTFIVLLIILVLYLVIQTVAILVIYPFPVHDSIGALISQILATCIMLIVYNKVPLYKFLKLIEKNILIKSCVFLASFVSFSIVVYLNLNYEGVKLNVFYFLLLSGIAIIGFIVTIHKLYYFTNKLPFIHHEMRNVLASLYISAYNNKASNLSEIETYLKILGMDVFERDMENMNSEEACKNIVSFIEYKKQSNSSMKKIVFDTEICYYESFKQIPEPAVMIMLAILLDNAMDASPSGKKIKVYLHISEDVLILEIANASKMKITDLAKMFEKGKTTKDESRYLHGYGLSKLTEIVNEYKGEIFLESKFIKEELSRYIFIRTEFKHRFIDCASIPS